MESKKFVAVTVVLYLSSLISYYSQIKIIDLYGLDVKYYLDLYTSYFQITITLVILGLPNAISLMVSRDNKIPKNISLYSFFFAALSSSVLNLLFLDGDFIVQMFIFVFMYMSLSNDLNTGVMNSIGMFEYPRVWQLVGNISLLSIVIIDPFNLLSLDDIPNVWYALLFIIIPIAPLFFVLVCSNKFRKKSSGYESVSLTAVSKYLSYIYLFSILSIVLTRIPYINFSSFIDKHSLAQYTLSTSLSNFMVIPLNLLTLKVLSSKVEYKINMTSINIMLVLYLLISGFSLHYINSNFEFINHMTNISSSDILTSTYLLVGGAAISSINLSVSLRFQRNLKAFFLLDLILVTLVFFITLNIFYSSQYVSEYNYIISSVILLKILFQTYLLRERNVHDYNCEL
ncbi:hypothetical protein BCT19_18425 [Vibrio splendidus]|uniref:hypothetical protein n=1 Tax=Vibrio splendidus TaxID=29497 RepID=UPI000C84FEE7|nr:hypothetical protein [Vibrio splendidus]MCC5519745.1 hypothetical protein [Vibrio splendidus]PMO03255.1 hypothetical protein BCT19_18425 [Vibrio splendidus]